VSGCAKIYLITRDQLARALRGETRVRNLPGDAEIVALQALPSERGEDLAVRVHSLQFKAVPKGEQLPVVIAVTEANR
jgi:hypothetical protein